MSLMDTTIPLSERIAATAAEQQKHPICEIRVSPDVFAQLRRTIDDEVEPYAGPAAASIPVRVDPELPRDSFEVKRA